MWSLCNLFRRPHITPDWFAKTPGRDYAMAPTMSFLDGIRNDFSIFSGLDHCKNVCHLKPLGEHRTWHRQLLPRDDVDFRN
jgi:hypothetical protein